MIITRGWLKDFIDISSISTQDICKTLNSIGLEVDSLKTFSIPKKVVIGKVIEKEKHQSADKLNVCKVDLGYEIAQIVCGAKNVEVGQFVPVATIGCQLKEDFVIKKANLRGIESNGMICSSTELGLCSIDEGILVLDDSIGEIKIGNELNTYELLCDDVIEIGLTPNRGDCLSVYGVARELSAYYGIPLIDNEKNINYNEFGIRQTLEINKDNNIESKLLYKVADLKDFKLPLISKLRTAIIGKYNANNRIENILSYASHSIGILLNAYTKNQTIQNNDIHILNVKKDQNDFDCIFGNDKLSIICVNQNEKYDASDNKVIFEASYINPEIISQKVFKNKIKTSDIYYRATRGSEPDVEFGMSFLAAFISKYGAIFYRGNENNIEDIEKETITVNINKLNSIIGEEIKKEEIERILKVLNFEVKESTDDLLIIKIPYYRHDIKNVADITEEVVRIIGIDNINAKPLKIDEVNRVNKTSIDLIKKNNLRYKSISNGFSETLTYVFTSKENLQKYGFKTVKEELDLINPIVKELNTYRTTMLLNLVEACSNNFKIGSKSTSFFEIGTVFDENRNEKKKISFVQTGYLKNEDYCNSQELKKIDFFSFAQKLINIIGNFDLEPIDKINNLFIHPYQNANIIINKRIIGTVYKLNPNVCIDFDLNDTFLAEIDFDEIKNETVKTSSYSKFQASKKDLSIIVPKNLSYSKIKETINNLNNKNIKQFNLIDVYNDEKLGEYESLTIRFILQSDEKTLEDQDITSIIDSILEELKEKLLISLR